MIHIELEPVLQLECIVSLNNGLDATLFTPNSSSYWPIFKFSFVNEVLGFGDKMMKT